MPKLMLKTSAAAPAAGSPPPVGATSPAPAVAPAAVKKPQTPDEMRASLTLVGLTPEAIEAAIASIFPTQPAAAGQTTESVPAEVVNHAADLEEGAEPMEAAPPAPTPAPVAAPAPAKTRDQIAEATLKAHEAGMSAKTPEPAAQRQVAAPAAPEGDNHPTVDHEEPGDLNVTVKNAWSRASGGTMQGDFNSTDFKVPTLKIIQGNSPKNANFTQGDTVLMDEVLFLPPTPAKPSPIMRFVPLLLQKYFRENPPERDPKDTTPLPPPRNAITAVDVKKLGGTTDWTVGPQGERLKPSWSPAAKLTLLLEKPEGSNHPGFNIEVKVGEKVVMCQLVVMYVNGGQYRSFAKPIIDATNFILRDGDGIVLHKRVWKMQVLKELSGDYVVFNPIAAIVNEITAPEVVKLAKRLISGEGA